MEIKYQYDKIGNDYITGQKSFFSDREDKAIQFIKKSLPSLKEKTLLDIGCGSGQDMLMYQKMGAESVYGIDSSEFMISKAKENINRSENARVGDIESTKFKDESFNVVVGRFSFHYLGTYNKAYKEMARILKKGGNFIIVVHHPFKDLTLQKNKTYGKQEIISTQLYHNKVSISFPTHTLNDYFTDEFFRYFYIVDLKEEESPEEYLEEMKLPGFLGISAIKR